MQKQEHLLLWSVAADENFQRAKPILKNMGKKIIHAGDAGNGQAAKICNNLILGISMIAVSEAIFIGGKIRIRSKKSFLKLVQMLPANVGQ